jgi:serine/threonine protein phosphatase 1
VWHFPFSKTERFSPAIPNGTRIYAIGDVHGCADLLDGVLSRINADLSAHPSCRVIQVFIGDYIDRGPASSEVIDRLIEHGCAHETVFLKGNHETYFLEFLKKPDVLEDWRHVGGLETLLSYGLKPSLNPSSAERKELAKALNRVLPESHRQFLFDLKSSFVCGDFFFAHAGVQPGIALSHQDEDDLLWIRNEFTDWEGDFGKVIVHGHTPVLEPEAHPNRINIDTGCYASGQLTCLRIEGGELRFITQKRQWTHNPGSLARSTSSRAVGNVVRGEKSRDSMRTWTSVSEDNVFTHEIQRPVPADLAPPVGLRPMTHRTLGHVSLLVIVFLGAFLAFSVTRDPVSSVVGNNAEQEATADEREAERAAAVEAQKREAERAAAAETQKREAERAAAAETQKREAERAAAVEAEQREAERAAAAETQKREAERAAAVEAQKREAELAAAMEAQREAERAAAAEAQKREAERAAALQAEQRDMPAAPGPAPTPGPVVAATQSHPAEIPGFTPRRLESEEIAMLIKQGEAFLASGDIASARLMLQRAAEAGDAQAALTLARIYDLGVRSSPTDLAIARAWYEIAKTLGSADALHHLERLAHPH